MNHIQQLLLTKFLDLMNFWVVSLGLPRVPSGPQGSRDSSKCIFFSLKHTKQLLLLTFCETPAGIEVSFCTERQSEGTMDRMDRQA